MLKMNISILVSSFRYLANRSSKQVISLSIWIYQELSLINCTIQKRIQMIHKNDFEIVQSIIGLNINQDLDLLFYLIKLEQTAEIYELIKLLVKSGIDNYIVLLFVIRKNNIKIVKLLIQTGIDIQLDNNLALSIACWCGHAEIVELLVKSGAIIDERALENARWSQHWNIVELLHKLNSASVNLL